MPRGQSDLECTGAFVTSSRIQLVYLTVGACHRVGSNLQKYKIYWLGMAVAQLLPYTFALFRALAHTNQPLKDHVGCTPVSLRRHSCTLVLHKYDNSHGVEPNLHGGRNFDQGQQTVQEL